MPLEGQLPVHLRFLIVQLHHFEVASNSALRLQLIETLDAQNKVWQPTLYTDEVGQINCGRYAVYVGEGIRVLVLPRLDYCAHRDNREARAFVFLRLGRGHQPLPKQAASWRLAISEGNNLLHSLGITTHLKDATLLRVYFAWDTPPLHLSLHPFFTHHSTTHCIPENLAPWWGVYPMKPSSRADRFNYERFTPKRHKNQDASQPLRIEARFSKHSISHHLGLTTLGDLANQEQSSTRLQCLLSQRFQELSYLKEANPEESLNFDHVRFSLLMLKAAHDPQLAKCLRDSLNQLGIWNSPKTFEPHKVTPRIDSIGASGPAALKLPFGENLDS